jgi:hypothetical protein
MRAAKLSACALLIAMAAATLAGCSSVTTTEAGPHRFTDDGSRADVFSPFGSPAVGPYLLPR